MKKVLLPLALLAAVSAQAQTKKVIVEDFTGAWCGWCPEGTVLLENLKTQHGARLITIGSHVGDQLEIPAGAAIDAGLEVQGYPNGAVDRKKYTGNYIPMGRGSWSGAVNTQMAKTAIVSVSFANYYLNTTTGNYEADVKVKFTAAPTAGVPIKVNVYLLEDSIAATGAYSQGNYSGNVQSGASPLTNWWHNYTLRSAVGGNWGWADAVPATPVVNTTYTKHITFMPNAAWKTKNMSMVAYVAYDGAAASDQKEIMNSESMRLSSVNKLGVEQGQTGLSVVNVYPNPGRSNGIINMEYNITESSNVKLEIYNAVGQLVDVPYNSVETEGTHTINWAPAEKGLPAGMYMMQLTTSKGGKITQRISVL